MISLYTYDLCGNVLTETDGLNKVKTYKYNVRNLLMTRIDVGGIVNGAEVESKLERYKYDMHGRLKETTDRNGVTITFNYDFFGNLRSKTVGGNTISYTYDKNGNELTMKDNTGTTTRTYDEENRVLTKTVPESTGQFTFMYDIIEANVIISI